MKLTYVGPHEGGLQQIGSTPIDVPHGEPVEIPDHLAEVVLAQSPDDWEQPKSAKKSAKKSAASDEENAS